MKVSKIIFFIIVFCTAFVLMLSKSKPTRYQIIGAGDNIQLYDIKTGNVYYYDQQASIHCVDLSGKDQIVKKLPE
jgi:hypothetical protein